MQKIPLSKIDPKCFVQKGFDERGCYGCSCDDSCCKFGADFDKAAFDLVVAHRSVVEPLVGRKVELCFKKQFSGDCEYLGGDAIKSVKGENGFCVFHNKEGKGCILYGLVSAKGLDRRIIPSICRLFPLSWGGGKLVVYDSYKGHIPADCNCLDPTNLTTKSIWETQKDEIEDIFAIDKVTK